MKCRNSVYLASLFFSSYIYSILRMTLFQMKSMSFVKKMPALVPSKNGSKDSQNSCSFTYFRCMYKSTIWFCRSFFPFSISLAVALNFLLLKYQYHNDIIETAMLVDVGKYLAYLVITDLHTHLLCLRFRMIVHKSQNKLLKKYLWLVYEIKNFLPKNLSV